MLAVYKLHKSQTVLAPKKHYFTHGLLVSEILILPFALINFK